jgi:uncharacterized membrane-anchored protein YitT (DUF2179 family)
MFKHFKKEDTIIKTIYKKGRFKRYIQFIFGVFLVASAFNLFVLPMKITYGVSGIAVILNNLFGYDPSIVIMIGGLVLLTMSYFLLGKEKTAFSVIGSILYPVFVKLTASLPEYIDISIDNDPLLIAIFAAVISGFGLGLIFKSGFTTGGTDILNQIVAKYFKMSIGNAMFFTDGVIIISGLFFFSWINVMYSLLALYIISVMSDKVILGISQSKVFYIITDHETAVKKFIIEHLSHGVTVLEASGGFTGNRQKVIMCTIPTKEYFLAKEGIHSIDKDAFFVVADAYEVYGGE